MNDVFEALVNGSIVSAGMTLTLWIILRMTHRKRLNAASRYWVWWATLGLSMLTIALFLYVRPPAPDSTADAVERVRMRTGPAGSGIVAAAPDSVLPQLPGEERSPLPSSGFFPLKIHGGVWLRWIMLAWLAASTLMLARLILSYLLIEAKRSRAIPMAATQAVRLERMLKKVGLSRQVQLLISAETPVPMATGLHRPCIVFPSNLVRQLQQEELDQIALHEAGHLVRHDDYGLILQRVIQALFVFHPLVHWICRQIDIEREIACDDFVLGSAQEGLLYASSLTRVAELSGGVDGMLGALAVSSRPALVQRIELLLDETQSRSIGLMKIRLALVVAGLIASGWIGVLLPRAVVFAAARQTPAALIQLQVLVRDRLGRYVSGLEREHFRVLEDGREQEITQFSISGPVSLYVVVNISGGASSELIAQAGRSVLSNLGTDDEYALTDVRGSRDAQPASLIDGIEQGLEKLRSSRNLLKAVVVVSDWDGLMYPQDATERLREVVRTSDVPIYILSSAPTNALLDEVASATGGDHVVITTPEEAQNHATRVLVAVRNSYILGFRREQAADGTFRQIGVEVVPPKGISNLSAKIRAGYYAR